jgi:hypothetical protein
LALVNGHRISGRNAEFEISVGLTHLRQRDARIRVPHSAKGQMAGKRSLFFGPARQRQPMFNILLQTAQLVAIPAAADPYHSGTSAAETADGLYVEIEGFVLTGSFSHYIADLNSLFVFDFAQELERQVHGIVVDPFDVAFFDVSFALQLLLEVAQDFFDLFINIYGYEDSHAKYPLLKTC